MARYQVTFWIEYASIHDVEANNEQEAIEIAEEDPTTETDTYYGDIISIETREVEG